MSWCDANRDRSLGISAHWVVRALLLLSCVGPSVLGRDAPNWGVPPAPVQQDLPVGQALPTPVRRLEAGGDHTCALQADTTVWCWGNNSHGQLGDGSTTLHYTPVAVVGLSGVTALAASNYHTCALRHDTTAWCWGTNHFGQLGDSTTTAHHTPVAGVGLSGMWQRFVEFWAI